MFLKSVTMRGFKSFADRTTLEFEPGITVIVGPNGSGKSNVVDALAWVLGTRSPKLLRGGELSDVIFAGSPSRNALGSALVEIAIDNSHGQLGLDGVGAAGSAKGFSEVTISREILATGESIYGINGEECRLLDIQELLSDTGLGRELHTIVGQGHLDDILQAKPEDRRAFVEEAAGILKHRRRRERAERKLAQVDVHVERLRTVIRELRRQLRPLERQAEAANEHERLQAELREVRINVAAYDLAQLQGVWEREAGDDEQLAARQRAIEVAVAERDEVVTSIEERLREGAPAIEATRDTGESLARLRERLRGTADLIEARRRHLMEYVEEPLAGRPPDDLRAQAARLDEDRAELEEELAQLRAQLDDATAASQVAQDAAQEHDRRIAAATRARSEARERLARWEGLLSSRRNALAAAEAEAQRFDERTAELDARLVELRAEVEGSQDGIRGMDADERELTDALEAAEAALTEVTADYERLLAEQREKEQARASTAARLETLRAAVTSTGNGVETLLGADLEGVAGLLADHLRVARGYEAAVAAALGPLGQAVLVRSTSAARDAVSHLRASGAGRAVVLPGRATADAPAPIAGATPLAELLEPTGPDGTALIGALRGALGATYLVETWEDAVARHERHPEATFVTPEGDLAGPHGFVGGAAPENSAVLLLAAADEAERTLAALDRGLDAIHAKAAAARDELATRREELDDATARINESDARITGLAEELGRLTRELHAVERQRDAAVAHRDELDATIADHRRAIARLESEEPSEPEDDPVDDEGESIRLRRDVEAARSRELEARLAVERVDGRAAHLVAAAADLREEASAVERALAEAARRRELRRRHIRRCGELAAVCEEALAAIDTSIDDARAEREELERVRSGDEEELARARGRLRELTTELEAAREERHAADLRLADVRHKLDQIVERLREDFGLSADEALAEHADAAGADREELVAREDTLVRKLGLLGRVNPLALEEFHALEERHRFLKRQLEDLLASKRDLAEVIAAVDDKIREVFVEAFEDVAREFVDVFATVFPGGDGRLVLTDPGDPLTTGIEIEARPPGKRVRRLSLLSGGERSLTALAFLFAIFRARPSPFYVLDEVEAALDDVNLQRLLGVMESFKERSQLLVVTHQKRTMEVADVLYGVTMSGDAVSKVVAERMADAVA